jgi:hypothetical protein
MATKETDAKSAKESIETIPPGHCDPDSGICCSVGTKRWGCNLRVNKPGAKLDAIKAANPSLPCRPDGELCCRLDSDFRVSCVYSWEKTPKELIQSIINDPCTDYGCCSWGKKGIECFYPLNDNHEWDIYEDKKA